MFRELVYPIADDTLGFFALAQIKYHEVALFLHYVPFDIAIDIDFFVNLTDYEIKKMYYQNHLFYS